MTQTLVHKRTLQPFGVFKDSPSWLSQSPEVEHGADGVRYVEHSYYEGYVYACECGLLFVEPDELQSHIKFFEPKPAAQVKVSGKVVLAALGLSVIGLIGLYLFIVGMFAL